MTVGTHSKAVPRRVQFVNNAAVAADDAFEFSIEKEQATLFASAAFRVDKLVGDVKMQDAEETDWLPVSTDGDTFLFDGTATTVRVLAGPGHYRMVSLGSASGVYAGMDQPE